LGNASEITTRAMWKFESIRDFLQPAGVSMTIEQFTQVYEATIRFMAALDIMVMNILCLIENLKCRIDELRYLS
jgi:hypothetical protein